MSNIYNDPSSTNVKITALNNTYGYLSANIGKVKFGFATDLNKWCYSDIAGTIHKTLTDASGSTNTPVGRVFFADSDGSATSNQYFSINGSWLNTPQLMVDTKVAISAAASYGTVTMYNGGDMNIALDAEVGNSLFMGKVSIGTIDYISKLNIYTDDWKESAIQITNAGTGKYDKNSGLSLGIEEGNPNSFLRYNGYGNFYIKTTPTVGQPEETPFAIYNGYPLKTVSVGFADGSVVLNNQASIGTLEHTSKLNVHATDDGESAIQLTNDSTGIYDKNSGVSLGINGSNGFLKYTGYEGNFKIFSDNSLGENRPIISITNNNKQVEMGFPSTYGIGNIVLHGVIKQDESGSYPTSGIATLVAGQVTVNSSLVKSTSRIKLNVQSLGTVTRPQAIGVSSRVVGTSFTIMSNSTTDTSVVHWEICEPA